MSDFLYLDHASTSFPKPAAVVRAVEECLATVAGSPGRGGHAGCLEANRIVYRARERAAGLLGVEDSARIVLTSGATEALNVALRGTLAPGDHVVITDSEHNSVARPVAALEREGIAVSRVPLEADGEALEAALEAARRPTTRAAALVHASNVDGRAIDLEAAARWATRHDVLLGVDAAQSAGLLPIRVDAWGLGWVACSGHKALGGPPGVGILAVGPGARIAPLLRGGTGSRSDSDEQPEWLPDALEAGTPNTPGIAGLSAALAEVAAQGIETLHDRPLALARSLAEGLDAIDGVERWGPGAVPVVSFRVRDRDPSEIAVELEAGWGIRVRVGLHCAPGAHRRIGTFPEGTVRASFGATSTPEEVRALLDGVETLVARGGARA